MSLKESCHLKCISVATQSGCNVIVPGELHIISGKKEIQLCPPKPSKWSHSDHRRHWRLATISSCDAFLGKTPVPPSVWGLSETVLQIRYDQMKVWGFKTYLWSGWLIAKGVAESDCPDGSWLELWRNLTTARITANFLSWPPAIHTGANRLEATAYRCIVPIIATRRTWISTSLWEDNQQGICHLESSGYAQPVAADLYRFFAMEFSRGCAKVSGNRFIQSHLSAGNYFVPLIHSNANWVWIHIRAVLAWCWSYGACKRPRFGYPPLRRSHFGIFRTQITNFRLQNFLPKPRVLGRRISPLDAGIYRKPQTGSQTSL